MHCARQTLGLFVSILLLGSAGQAVGGGSRLESKYRQWLDDVSYIISSRERKEFRQLSSAQERDRFIEHFWRIRDPDLSTERNEFREEHYRRLRVADRKFYEGRAGRKTARGRIYIMHGPPDDTRLIFGGNALRIDIEKPTELLTGGQADARNFFRLEFVRPETEVWTYRHIPGARNVASYFEVIFSRIDSSQLHVLHQIIGNTGEGTRTSRASRLARDAAILQFLHSQRLGGRYQIVYAGRYKYSGIDDFYRSIFHPTRVPSFHFSDFQTALADLERSPGDVLEESLMRRRRLKEAVQSRVFYEELQLSLSVGSMRSRSGSSTLVPVTVGIASQYAGSTLELVVELLRPDGTSAAAISDAILIPKADKGVRSADYLYQTRLAVRPGHYRLEMYGRINRRRAMIFRQREIEVPDYSGSDLSVSDVLLFDRVLSRRQYRAQRERSQRRFVGGAGPLYLKDFVLLPAPDLRFRRREKLTALFEVYNPGLQRGEPALDVECRIWQASHLVAQLPGSLLNYLTDSRREKGRLRRTAYGFSIPLRSLRPGAYSLELQVHDRVLGDRISRRRHFTIY